MHFLPALVVGFRVEVKARILNVAFKTDNTSPSGRFTEQNSFTVADLRIGLAG